MKKKDIEEIGRLMGTASSKEDKFDKSLQGLIVQDVLTLAGLSASDYISKNVNLIKINSIIAFAGDKKKKKPNYNTNRRPVQRAIPRPVSIDRQEHPSSGDIRGDFNQAFSDPIQRIDSNQARNFTRTGEEGNSLGIDTEIPTGRGIVNQIESNRVAQSQFIEANWNTTTWATDVNTGFINTNTPPRQVNIMTAPLITLSLTQLRSRSDTNSTLIRNNQNILASLMPGTITWDVTRTTLTRLSSDDVRIHERIRLLEDLERSLRRAPEVHVNNTLNEVSNDELTDIDFEEARDIDEDIDGDIDGSYYKSYIENEIKKEAKKTFTQVKISNYQLFVDTFGGLPSLIKGYIIQGKLFTNNEDISKTYSNGLAQQIYKTATTIVKVFTIDPETGEVSSKLYHHRANQFSRITNIEYLRPILPILLKVRLKDIDLSVNVFGSSKEKKQILDNLNSINKDGFLISSFIKDWEIRFGQVKKLGGSTYYLVSPTSEDKEVKFILSDITFINEELKGYHIPEDKTMEIDTIVKIKTGKLSSYNIASTHNIGKILSIKSSPSSKRISKSCRNRRMDIMTVKLNTDKILNIYGQDLKFLSKGQKQYEPNSNKKEKPGLYNSEVFTINLEDFQFRSNRGNGGF